MELKWRTDEGDGKQLSIKCRVGMDNLNLNVIAVRVMKKDPPKCFHALNEELKRLVAGRAAPNGASARGSGSSASVAVCLSTMWDGGGARLLLVLAAAVVVAHASRLDSEGTGSPCYEVDAEGKDDLSKPQVSR
jgi:hypothetical protein